MDTPVASQEERTWALAGHLSALAGHLIPFGHIAGPLIVWLLKRDQMPLVDDQGKEALNFQISTTIYFIISAVLMLVLIGFALFAAVYLFWLIALIIAAVKAYEGTRFRYPLTIRFIK